MKKLHVILGVSAIAMTLGATLVIPYNNSRPPVITLPDAYQRATAALGPLTNRLHCLTANVTTDFDADGEWQFIFYSTNADPKWVTVEFNGKIHIENVYRR